MQTTLCFDLGNSRSKYAVFQDGAFQSVEGFSLEDKAAFQSILSKYKPNKSILSSVVHHPDWMEPLLAENSQFHLLGPVSKINFTTPVGKPSEIGADRLALCAAAVAQFPHQHNLIISLGTCITYNFVTKHHQFIGGSISPGMQMRFRAMHEQTALLPLITPSEEYTLVGYDTKTNLLSGVILGMAAEIDGIIGAYEEKYANFNVQLTGGDLSYFVPHLKKRIFADQNLLFKGLYAISETNNI